MTRRAARITQDEISRMVKAIRACGLPVGEVIFDGERVRVVINENSGDAGESSIDGPSDPADFQSLDEYLAWRDREDARAR